MVVVAQATALVAQATALVAQEMALVARATALVAQEQWKPRVESASTLEMGMESGLFLVKGLKSVLAMEVGMDPLMAGTLMTVLATEMNPLLVRRLERTLVYWQLGWAH